MYLVFIKCKPQNAVYIAMSQINLQSMNITITSKVFQAFNVIKSLSNLYLSNTLTVTVSFILINSIPHKTFSSSVNLKWDTCIRISKASNFTNQRIDTDYLTPPILYTKQRRIYMYSVSFSKTCTFAKSTSILFKTR